MLASFQVPRAEHSAGSPLQAIQVVTQFADDYLKIEEKLTLCEQELEEVKQQITVNICMRIVSFIQIKENDVAMNDGVLNLCKLWEEFHVCCCCCFCCCY